MTAPVVRGTCTPVDFVGANSVTIPDTVGAQDGDILVFFIQSPDGTTDVTSWPDVDWINGPRVTGSGKTGEMGYKLEASGEGASWTFGWSGSHTGIATVLVIDGSTADHQLNGTPAILRTSLGTSHSTPSLITTVDECLVIGMFGGESEALAPTTWSSTDTELCDEEEPTTFTSLAVYAFMQESAGSISLSATSSTSMRANCGIIAFSPVSVPPPPAPPLVIDLDTIPQPVATQYDIFLLNESRQPVAQIEQFRRLEIIKRFNDIGTWLITFDQTSLDLDLFDWKGGIRVLRNGENYFEGLFKVSEDNDIDLAEGALTIGGADYLWYLEKRLVVSVPSGPPYSASAYDVRSGAAGSVIKEYVRNHVSTLAKAARVVPGILVDTDQANEGSSVTGRGRFEPVIEIVRELALKGGDIGFRFDGNMFKTFIPQDLTAAVKFSREFGNLQHYKRRIEKPAANYIIAGGGGEGTARTFVEGGNQASINAFGRVEWFYDYRNAASGAELSSAINGKLEEMAEKVAIEAQVLDTQGVQFLRDYNIGDRVTVVLPRLVYQNVIREVKIVLDDSGEHITPVIGTPGARTLNALNTLFETNRSLTTRLGQIERV
jgi:hypothetical protein